MDATPQRCPPSIVAHRSESDTDSSGAASVWADWDRGSSAHKHRLSNITQETEPECPIKGRWTRHMLKYSLGYREWNDCACAAKGLPNNKTLIQADKKKKKSASVLSQTWTLFTLRLLCYSTSGSLLAGLLAFDLCAEIIHYTFISTSVNT